MQWNEVPTSALNLFLISCHSLILESDNSSLPQFKFTTQACSESEIYLEVIFPQSVF